MEGDKVGTDSQQYDEKSFQNRLIGPGEGRERAVQPVRLPSGAVNRVIVADWLGKMRSSGTTFLSMIPFWILTAAGPAEKHALWRSDRC